MFVYNYLIAILVPYMGNKINRGYIKFMVGFDPILRFVTALHLSLVTPEEMCRIKVFPNRYLEHQKPRKENCLHLLVALLF